jgi:hypothetical protein
VLGFGLATFYLFHLALGGPWSGAHPPARSTQPWVARSPFRVRRDRSRWRTVLDGLAGRGEIMHIVLFQFTTATPPKAMADVSAAFHTLRHTCRKPNGKPYILAIDGGTNISPEKAGKGYDVSGVAFHLPGFFRVRNVVVVFTFLDAHIRRCVIYRSHLHHMLWNQHWSPHPQHAYVVTFANVADRDYYVQDDVAHNAFKASLGDIVQDVLVFDFESGQFQRQAAAGGVKGGGSGRGVRRSVEEMHVRRV